MPLSGVFGQVASVIWKYSSIGIRSLAFGVASLPYGAEAKAAMTPATRLALEQPNSSAGMMAQLCWKSQRSLNDSAVNRVSTT